ncbi:MAG: anti-sigma F factor [Clostridia bacterium]
MKAINSAEVKFQSVSGNEAFARGSVTAFLLSLDPTVSELSDIKTAVSEAVTNAIIHGYKFKKGIVYINMYIYEDGKFLVKIRDKGCGIEDIEKAREPLFTTGGEEQAGIGFAVMESFCDKISVKSTLGKGTCVSLTKFLQKHEE